LAELALRDRWLVVFDNAEDPREVDRFLPDGPSQVVITSRNAAWRRVATPIGVREFTRTESVTLLRSLLPELADTDANQVAAAVGDLPLAVDQAGSLLADTNLTADAYLRLLGERADELLALGGGGSYPTSIAAAWGVAFERLATDDPAALDLLALAAWCGPEPVPLTLLTDQPDVLPDRLSQTVADPLALARCTGVLHRAGWRLSHHTACSCTGSPRRCCGPAPTATVRPRVGGRSWWCGCSARRFRARCGTARRPGRLGDTFSRTSSPPPTRHGTAGPEAAC
jgi:hypothetical protein